MEIVYLLLLVILDLIHLISYLAMFYIIWKILYR